MIALAMTATELLTKRDPESIFSEPNPDTIHAEYHKLAQKWHPDVCKDPKADEVLRHINELRDLAAEHLDKGIWNVSGLLTLNIKHWGDKNASGTGKNKLQIHYIKKHTFELGDFYICERSIVYVLNSGNEDLIENFIQNVNGFTYTTEKMKEEMSKYLPHLGSIMKANKPLETQDGHKILVINKTPDQVLLRDLLDYMPNLDPKHMAWIVSRLLNIACYLEHKALTYNDFSLDTIYLSPKYHTASILGGWWYATPSGSRLVAVPKRTLGLLPPSVISSKKASRRTDLELIRATAREMFKDLTGFGSLKPIPDPMVEWARFPSAGSAKVDYAFWMSKVLPAAFGKRSFTPLNVDIEQIYKEK